MEMMYIRQKMWDFIIVKNKDYGLIILFKTIKI